MQGTSESVGYSSWAEPLGQFVVGASIWLLVAIALVMFFHINLSRKEKRSKLYNLIPLTLLFFVLVFFCQSARASHGDCSSPGRLFPASTVPECVGPSGHAAACSVSSTRLWNSRIHPASGIPPHRDSTDLLAGKGVPGAGNGWEIFSSVNILETGGVPRRLYVSYNAGLQVWDIEDDPATEFDNSDPADPRFLSGADGWQGGFLSFPPVSEVLNFCVDVFATRLPGRDLVGLACYGPVGFSIWKYAFGPLDQLYQDVGTDSHQVRIVKKAAYVGTDNGVAIYNLTAAESLGSSCLDNKGSACPGVYRGTFADSGSPFSDRLRIYIDARYDAARDSVWVAAAGGLGTPAELWEVTTPGSPASATLRWTGPLHAQGVALWKTPHGSFVAWIDESQGLQNEYLEVVYLDCPNGHCISSRAIDPIQIGSSEVGTANDFLSYSNGWLYSGIATGQLFGPNSEFLFDVTVLRSGEKKIIKEITEESGSYIDPCNQSEIGYWSHLYSVNSHGLNNISPRVAKASSSGYLYRAAATILDVHKIEPKPGLPFESGFETGDLSEWKSTHPPE